MRFSKKLSRLRNINAHFVRKGNKTSQNIKRQLSDHIADINFIILRRYGAHCALHLSYGLAFLNIRLTQLFFIADYIFDFYGNFFLIRCKAIFISILPFFFTSSNV